MVRRLWSGRRDRLALSLIGALVLGMGLSVVAILSESVTGTVVRVYSRSWRTPYDILVHKQTEQPLPGLVEPNVLTSLPPGITRRQLEDIRRIDGVDVAAPLSVLGYVNATLGLYFGVTDPEGKPLQPGVYRVRETVHSSRSGLGERFTGELVFGVGDAAGRLPDWAPEGLFVANKNRQTPVRIRASANVPALLVGVDPAQEAALVGLDGAVCEGRYLRSTDVADHPFGPDIVGLPVLVNIRGFEGVHLETVAERLGPGMEPTETAFHARFEGLDIVRAMERYDPGHEGSYGSSWVQFRQLLGQSGLLQYEPMTSPFPERWRHAVRLQVEKDQERALPRFFSETADSEPYGPGQGRVLASREADLGRVFRSFAPSRRFAGVLSLFVVGYYDPQLLDVSEGDGRLPLDTYRPAEAELVLDPQGRPVNPPRKVYGGLTPTDFLSSPPVFLTTLDAALATAGEDAINAVRVKIEDDDLTTPETIARAKRIAREIEQRTGLVARVTMGSSPVDVLIYVPESNGHPTLGWVEEQWIHLDAAVTAVEQTEFGYSAFVAVALVVGLLYAVTTALAGVTARRRELGVALAVGWPGRALARLAVGEQALLGGAVGLMAALAAAVGGSPASAVGLALAAGPLLYLPAMAAAGRAVRGVSPDQALRWGDVAPGRRVLPGSGVLPLAAASLFGRPGRTLLTVVAIALPTALILLLSYIALNLRGVLYTSITGEYAALKVGPIQYAIGLVALAVAGVTAFDLVRQNAIDHRQERALLHALGWPRGRIGLLMVAEGAVLGLLAGVLGDLLGVGVVGLLYGAGVTAAWRTAAWVWLVPLGLGALTGLLSAMVELRSWGWQALAGVEARQVLRGGRALRWTSLAVALAALGTVLVLTVPRAFEEWRHRAAAGTVTADTSQPDAKVAQDIIARLEAQAEAASEGDLGGFLDTVDPDTPTYRMVKRHWFEDLQVWKQAHPQSRVSMEPEDVTLLGERSALVPVRVEVVDPEDPGASQVYLVGTVWVKRQDRWYEHGLDLKALEHDGVMVWHDERITEEAAQEAARAAGRVAARLKRELQLTPSPPLVLEWHATPDHLHRLLGPNLGTKRGIPPWVEYGEPLRVAGNHIPSQELLAYLLAQKAATDMSHNHASEWLREGVGRYVADRLAGRALAAAVTSVRDAGGLLRLPELPRYQNGLELPPTQWNRAADTAALLSAYLEQEHGQGTLASVLQKLARKPADPRMTGPATFEARSQATIEAIEEVTGKSWAELDQAFHSWFYRDRGY